MPETLLIHGYNISDIDDVYISHLHEDHCFGFPSLMLERYDWMVKPDHYSKYENTKQVRLFAETKVMKDLWDKVLEAPSGTFEGLDATIETVCEPVPVTTKEGFEWEGWFCRPLQQIHILSGSSIMNTFCLHMSKEGCKSVYFTTDSQYCSPEQVETWYGK